MKKTIACLLILALLAGAVPAWAEDYWMYYEEQRHPVEKRAFPMYVCSLDVQYPMPFYIVDEVDDIPYVDLADWVGFMNDLFLGYWSDDGYELTLETRFDKATLTRENGYAMEIDFDANTIYFGDYNGFLHDSTGSALLDILSVSGYDAEGRPELFERDLDLSLDRLGSSVTIELEQYKIELIHQDDLYLIPLQTLGDLLLSPKMMLNTYFNGAAVYIANTDSFGNAANGYTDLGKSFYSVTPGQRSSQLAEYSYHELCLVLDRLYGLQEIHGIKGFDQLFWEISYQEDLKSEDPQVADDALRSFINSYLDDIHSEFLAYSCLSGKQSVPSNSGAAQRQFNRQVNLYRSVRREQYPNAIPFYEEIGNTAYITFDSFQFDNTADYYTQRPAASEQDTVALIAEAHARITRPGSPIENVVLDLSNNTGGMVDAALFVIGWYLGDIPFSVKDNNTGAMSIVMYRSDVNLDHQFDEKDTVADKNLYCLISPVSFSCGNLVPAAFKSSQQVTLLGRTSGGGSCTVQPLSTAYGSRFQISSSQRFSVTKNGSFYDIDQGVEPDCYIDDVRHFYDRQYLTDYINGLL